MWEDRPVQYDGAALRRFAAALYSDAWLVTAGQTLLGSIAGGFLGWVAGRALGGVLLVSAVGALVGGIAGYLVGSATALFLRAAAQLALCQVQIEENTRPSGINRSGA